MGLLMELKLDSLNHFFCTSRLQFCAALETCALATSCKEWNSDPARHPTRKTRQGPPSRLCLARGREAPTSSARSGHDASEFSGRCVSGRTSTKVAKTSHKLKPVSPCPVSEPGPKAIWAAVVLGRGHGAPAARCREENCALRLLSAGRSSQSAKCQPNVTNERRPKPQLRNKGQGSSAR